MTWIRRLRRRVGHRGAILLCLAVVDLGYGLSLVGPSSEDVGARATTWREIYAPLWVWGIGWLIVSVVLIISAFMRSDEIGYVTAIGWKVIWSLSTLVSWLVGGVERGWVSAIIWAVVAAMVLVISSWPEPVTKGDE